MSTRLIGQLNTLESTGLIRLITVQPVLEYLFRHALVQDAAYNSLLRHDRRQLHLTIGAALEQLYPEQRAEQAAILAYHFEKAEALDKAIHYLTLAGDRARDGYANPEALAFYRAALGHIEQLLSQANAPTQDWYEKQAGLFESLADVLELLGQHDMARATYNQALTALAQLGKSDGLGQARLYRKIGLVFTVSRQYQEAQQAWDQGEQALGPRPTQQTSTEQTRAYWQEWIEIQAERAWNLYWQFRTDEIDRLCAMLVPVMEQYGTLVQLARVKSIISLACIQHDRYLPSDETVVRSQEALTTALAANNFHLILDGRFGLGFAHLWRREFDQAEGPLQESMRMAERSGDAIRTSRCVTYLMMLARMRRQVAETQSFIPQVQELVGGQDDPLQLHSPGLSGMDCLGRGRFG